MQVKVRRGSVQELDQDVQLRQNVRKPAHSEHHPQYEEHIREALLVGRDFLRVRVHFFLLLPPLPELLRLFVQILQVGLDLLLDGFVFIFILVVVFSLMLLFYSQDCGFDLRTNVYELEQKDTGSVSKKLF